MSKGKKDAARLPTESELARLFVDKYRREIRIVNDQDRWLIREDLWRVDKHRAVESMAREFIETLNSGGDARMGSRNTVRAVVDLARTDRRISVLAEELDREPHIIGTPAGPINLKTGKLIKLGRHLVTQSTSVTADLDGDCPRWRKFLREVCEGDRELIGYLQRWAGYLLTGDTREEAVLVIHGPAKNGKSTFVKMLENILGDYHRAATKSTFTAGRWQTHLAEIAFLRNARMVSLSETDQGESWAEATLKSVVSGELTTAREMRQNAFMFRPVFKLVTMTNHLPRLKSADEAMRRRLKIVRFEFSPTRPNKNLGDELAEEAPAVLAWMIEGAVKWYRTGLGEPQSVQTATQEYVEMYDPFTNWLSRHVVEQAGYFTATVQLTESYNGYLLSRELTPISEIEMGKKMEKAGYQRGNRVARGLGKRARGFKSVLLR